MTREIIQVTRATARTANGRDVSRHAANQTYKASVIQRFADGSVEIEWADARTRTFLSAAEYAEAVKI